jgi:transcription elongation factor Elf1
MLSELEKSELCKRCGKCCQCLVLPVTRPTEINKAIMEDWLDARGCEIIRETKDNLYIKLPYSCPSLVKSDSGGEPIYKCNKYHQRPQGCKIFDGSVHDFLDCAWKKAEMKYVVDLKKSGYTCPMCGKTAVQVGPRFKRDYLWVRRFRCPKGHIFEEVQ